MNVQLALPEHPLFYPRWFECQFPEPLEKMASPDWLLQMLSKDGEVPVAADQVLRDQVRTMLRWGGFKPSGRSKPASEFLEKASSQGTLGSINLAVDLCNVVSLWSGFPISVLDRDLCKGNLSVDVIKGKQSYVFNPSGQELDLEGLLCLCDEGGPCGSPVKDSQHTKTNPQTRNTFCLIWGEKSASAAVEAAFKWYSNLCQRAGCRLVFPA